MRRLIPSCPIFLLVTVALPVSPTIVHGDEPCCSFPPRCVADLKNRCPSELWNLFTHCEVGNVPVGDLDGQVLYVTDRFGGAKVWCSNLVWRGKNVGLDTYTANRWIGNQRRIGACHIIGPSWVDGRPAITLDYPRGTPIFSNMHDEIREIAPGLYLGLMFDGDPCRRFRGYFAIEIPKCKAAGLGCY